jgi:hypothetical protein
MLVFGVKMGLGRLICVAWANQARKERAKTFENIRKRSKNGVKRLKIFKNIRHF